jgi:hypothetical protein
MIPASSLSILRLLKTKAFFAYEGSEGVLGVFPGTEAFLFRMKDPQAKNL